MANIIIFDALDTLMGYRGAPKGASKQFYQEHLAQQAEMTREAFLQTTPYGVQLEQIVRETERGNLEPVMLEGAEQTLRYVNERRLTPVIITADSPEGARLTTKPMVDAGLVLQSDVHAIARLGKKSDPEVWKKAETYFAPFSDWFPKVMAVFEDSEEYLTAACQAYGRFISTNREYLLGGCEASCIVPVPGFLVQEEATHGEQYAERKWRGNHTFLRQRLEEVLAEGR